jgi:hypothetical protein
VPLGSVVRGPPETLGNVDGLESIRWVDTAVIRLAGQTYAHVVPEVQGQVATKMDEIFTPKTVATNRSRPNLK